MSRLIKSLVQQKDFSDVEESDEEEEEDEEDSKTVDDQGLERKLVKTIILISQRILTQCQ